MVVLNFLGMLKVMNMNRYVMPARERHTQRLLLRWLKWDLGNACSPILSQSLELFPFKIPIIVSTCLSTTISMLRISAVGTTRLSTEICHILCMWQGQTDIGMS